MADAFFLDAGSRGQRYALFHAPAGSCRGHVLYLHPFAEEMNKARRMAALQSRAFAAAGYAVLQLDLLGCGDSSGDFGDASWQDWLLDAQLGVSWLEAQGDAPLCLWGLRAGCLLAAQTATTLAQPPTQLWWQPPASGKLLATQWLRLKTAGELVGSAAKGEAAALQQQLREGQAVDIAGYRCAAALLQGLEQAQLQPPPARLAWFELSRQEQPALLPVSAKTVSSWQAQGLAVQAQALPGQAFWQTSEIETAPALLAASTAWLQGL
jgi:exosortase A-associated hydrolase 2